MKNTKVVSIINMIIQKVINIKENQENTTIMIIEKKVTAIKKIIITTTHIQNKILLILIINQIHQIQVYQKTKVNIIKLQVIKIINH